MHYEEAFLKYKQKDATFEGKENSCGDRENWKRISRGNSVRNEDGWLWTEYVKIYKYA